LNPDDMLSLLNFLPKIRLGMLINVMLIKNVGNKTGTLRGTSSKMVNSLLLISLLT